MDYQQYCNLMESFHDPCDGMIYHYTSPQSFYGIIESGEIWLTNTEFVNDVTECKALLNEANLFKEHELKFNPSVQSRWQEFLRDTPFMC